PGEIVIRTPYRSLGYINAPDEQRLRFVANPWARAGDDDLIYRTGDVGRLRPDGLLEFLGRTDDQVKVRGVRIELGEIERVLSDHPDVREAVVMLRPEGASGPTVTAYFVPRAGRSVTATMLRAFARTRLPEVMVPAAWQELAMLPVTAHGKVD